MLLKSGYKQVYVSRTFAIKAGLVSPKVCTVILFDSQLTASTAWAPLATLG